MKNLASKSIRTNSTSKIRSLIIICKTLSSHSPSTLNDSSWTPFDDNGFQRIFNELTKKAKLYKVKDFDKLAFTFNQYVNESLFSLIILWDSCSWPTDKSMKHLKKIIIENFPDVKSFAINFYG